MAAKRSCADKEECGRAVVSRRGRRVGEQAGSLHLCAGRSCAVHKVVVGRGGVRLRTMGEQGVGLDQEHEKMKDKNKGIG